MTPTPSSVTELSPAVFRPIDRHFAQFLERLAGGHQPGLALAAALASRASGDGHVCLDLPRAADGWPKAEARPEVLGRPTAWIGQLRQSPVVGTPGEFKPLVLDRAGRLYLHRYWEHESRLAATLRQLAESVPPGPAPDLRRLGDGLRRCFPDADAAGPDWQQVAAFAALRRRLCVISGGPGTGKTHTVVVLLALLLEQAGDNPLRVALAAPTGKAAARLQESVLRLSRSLALPDPVRARLPSEASTVHRLLGARPGQAAFRHHAGNPLALDVLIVDEASMVDLALMARLFEALPAHARVVLLGDKDQLASVEAGAVLGDLCAGHQPAYSAAFADDYRAATGQSLPAVPAGAPRRPLSDCLVQLERNRRFAPDSGLLALSRAVNRGDAEGALQHLRAGRGLTAAPLPPAAPARLKAALRPVVLDGYRAAVTAPDPAAALAALGRFRILAALRHGPHGVETLNALVTAILAEEGLIRPAGPWFAGRPVMITENDHTQRLFNGDIGVALPGPDTGEGPGFRVHFQAADGTTRDVSPARLPRHETAFALTVHKSQGSEFDRVLLVLPGQDSPVLTRELIYTGITRARAGVTLWLEEKVFADAVHRRVQRTSGLRDALWE